MASDANANAGPPLDEIQWRTPPNFEGGIHTNSVLYYFAQSPFFDKTSNNEVVFQQGLNNPNMLQFLKTREQFEGRLKTMSGLEFIVAQEPAETGPGAGTGVWTINKQTRRKRQGEEDEIVVHSVYFIVGENIYMAPTLFDRINASIASISTNISHALSTADSVQTWSAALGRTYQTLSSQSTTTSKPRGLDSKEATPAPSDTAKPKTAGESRRNKNPYLDNLLVEESLMIHEQFGGEFMDKNPITGKPGEFHLSSTGRNVKLSAPKSTGPLTLKDAALPVLNTKLGDNPLAKTGKETKSPKTPTLGKPKRRKSKIATTPS
ncbi:MED6 mediator sub complex component-domain-containing protein [Podospora appendiculata]|uniref:Mediator of RNA polymerase II transcription subunit 6 n=1 Tax=Podospora appendiculata TaxID=314037 RepID=A0AAE0X637_9PEZI|nr:MED6 mediator sub complex component-domain-containing protein [Podospora appendiculata]